ncbi:hypothetical protein ACIQF6_22950 [Kitasatospora sp. NPDC092948]|uniref:hypothetical protein n=1 Tax=Kitasatospora sp. NPDC092948 TaxID=3364088 RepID=UPI00382F5561
MPADSAARFAGRVVGRAENGDHGAFLLDPLGDGVAAPAPDHVLTLRDVADLEAGHPTWAPTGTCSRAHTTAIRRDPHRCPRRRYLL